jgi:hypothetical protein
VIAGQLVVKPVDGRQCHLRAIKLGDRDGPVEGDDRRGVEADELVVEGDDLRPGRCFDPSAASLSATSRSGASMTQKPARYSFDSRKGPSVNTASSPRLSMTVAGSGDPRPPAKTQ